MNNYKKRSLTFFLVVGIILVVFGIIVINYSDYFTDNSLQSGLSAFFVGPTSIFFGFLVLFIWFLEYFKTPRQK